MRAWRWALLAVGLVAFLGGSTVQAHIYVPPMAVERITVYVAQDLSRFMYLWGARLRQTVAYVAAIATGALTGKVIESRRVEIHDNRYAAYRPLVEELADPVADSVVEPVVWTVEEARIIALSPSELEGNFGYWNVATWGPFEYRFGGFARAYSLAEAKRLAWERFNQNMRMVKRLEEWLPEAARRAGFWSDFVGEEYHDELTIYYEVPEVLRVPPWSSSAYHRVDWENQYFVEVPAPGVEILLSVVPVNDTTNQYTVAVVPAYMYLLVPLTASYRVRLGAHWCYPDDPIAEVVGWWAVRYEFHRYDAAAERPIYRPVGAGEFGGVAMYSGMFPRADGKSWYFTVYRLYGSASSVFMEASFVMGQIASVWARICAGVVSSIESIRYPWDVQGAPDFGTSVRQRDGALVWWLARPLEVLREAFVPRVLLSNRLAGLSAYAAERFPWSVYHALRVPPALEVSLDDLPCFSVGNGYQLCPHNGVVRAVGTATRAGFGLVAFVGVVWWLGRRISPSLRI